MPSAVTSVWKSLSCGVRGSSALGITGAGSNPKRSRCACVSSCVPYMSMNSTSCGLGRSPIENATAI